MKELKSRPGKYQRIFPFFLAALLFLSFLPAESGFSRGLSNAARGSDRLAAKNTLTLADSSRLNLLYDSLQLNDLGLSAQAYHKAMTGFLNLVAAGRIPNRRHPSINNFFVSLHP